MMLCRNDRAKIYDMDEFLNCISPKSLCCQTLRCPAHCDDPYMWHTATSPECDLISTNVHTEKLLEKKGDYSRKLM